MLTVFVNLQRGHCVWRVCCGLVGLVTPESREAGKARFEMLFVQPSRFVHHGRSMPRALLTGFRAL